MCERPSLWLGLREHPMSTLPRRVSLLCVTETFQPFCVAFWSISLFLSELVLLDKSPSYIKHVYDVIAMAGVFSVTAAYKVMLYINKYAANIITHVYHPSRKQAVTGWRVGQNLGDMTFLAIFNPLNYANASTLKDPAPYHYHHLTAATFSR